VKGAHLHISRFLVKYRVVLFILMTLLTIGSALLIPHINVNSNMVRYLPDASPMKQGLDILVDQLPEIQNQTEEFGGVFSDGEDLMPTDLPKTLAIGVALLFVVLLVMSSSVLEVLLFLVAIGFAVIINMGTNALLDSVSTLTNTLASVLQMVLSMDYSIILMNRYRQERKLGREPVSAMEQAVGGAASSILSSAFTTIVSLLMLCFIKMKIGADLGVVLAKGVTFSLICNFTVLPALIVWCDRGIAATRKKVPVLPASPLARFQYRFRVPIAITFLVVFLAFTLLQRRTKMSFSPGWESNIASIETRGNALMLLYANADENAVPALLEGLAADPEVKQTLSYPSLVKRPRTIPELGTLAEGLGGAEGMVRDAALPELPEDMLSLVYYAKTHPQRTERFSLQELMATAEQLSESGLLPEGVDPSALAAGLMPPEPVERAVPKPAPEVEPKPVPEQEPAHAQAPEPVKEATDTIVLASPEMPPESPVDAPAHEGPYGWITYELAQTPLSSDEIAAYTGSSPSQISMIFRMAGKRRGKMTLPEFTAYVRDNILGNRRYAAFVPKGMDEQLKQMDAVLDSVLAAGPDTLAAITLPAAEETNEMAGLAGHDEKAAGSDSTVIPGSDRESKTAGLAGRDEEIASCDEEADVPTPQEVLLDMYLSARKYTAGQLYPALSAAGIKVSREELEFLFLYAGAKRDFDPETAVAPGALLDYVADTLLVNPLVAQAVPDSVKTLVGDIREQLLSGVGMLRGPDYSAAVVMSGYDAESDATFSFIERVQKAADQELQHMHYLIGESQMYKELRDGFPRELLLLTLLTVLSIFLIVAVTFRSVLVPIPLIMTILAGVYANVWASGLGGNTLYYLSFLIIQGILMGATIDYSILFTNYYRNARRSGDVREALEGAYRGASHSIMTSGLILAIVPFVMSVTMADPMISSILSSLAIGAFSILLLILFLLPGVLAAIDPLISRRRKKEA